MFETGIEDGMGDESDGNEVNISNVEDLMVNEKIVEVRGVDVSRVEATEAFLFCIPSPILKFVPLLDKSIGMSGV